MAIVGFEGVTAIDTNAVGDTVNTEAGLVTPLILAVMLVVPVATLVARPLESIVAVAVVAEFQVTCKVMLTVVESLKVPIAVNCCVAPLAIAGFTGVTAMDCSVAGVTVNKVEPVTPLKPAVIVLVPVLTAVDSPPAAVMVAVAVVPEIQVTVEVMFFVELSL